MANMASIMADIGDRSAPAAAGAGRRAGPSRICIGISSSPPSPGSPHAGARRPQHWPAPSALARHGPRRRDLRTALTSPRETELEGGLGFWKLLEAECWWRGEAAGWCVIAVMNGFGGFSLAAIWSLENPAAVEERDDTMIFCAIRLSSRRPRLAMARDQGPGCPSLG